MENIEKMTDLYIEKIFRYPKIFLLKVGIL
jgi:hypothetical protein